MYNINWDFSVYTNIYTTYDYDDNDDDDDNIRNEK